MGWLFMSSLGSHRGPREYLDDQFTSERPGRSAKVLRSALVRMRTYYAAVEVVAEGGEREVWACVRLVRYNPRPRGLPLRLQEERGEGRLADQGVLR